MKKKNLVINILVYAFLILVFLITMLPIVYTVLASFKSNAEIMTHPESLFPIEPTVKNYIAAWNGDSFNVGKMFFNSCYYTVFVMVITLTISTATGYVFARGGNFPGSKIIFALFSVLMFINFGSITIYAVFRVLKIFGLSDSLWGLIVMKFFSIGTVNIYIVRSYVRTISVSIDEAAEIDGCSFMGIFVRIIAPLLTPVIATLALLSFQASWNEYMMPMLFTISRPEQRPLIVGIMALKNSGNAAANWNLMLAGATIALLPILAVYAICNKYFVEGLAAGAVKG